MPHTARLEHRNRTFPFPIAFPDDLSRYGDKASLLVLMDFNEQQGNAITATILDIVSRSCCDGLTELQNQENSDVWYQWNHSTWSPGVIRHFGTNQIIVGQKRRKRTSKAICPHRGYIRDDESDVICQWFELLPSTKRKPEPIRERSWYSGSAERIANLDAGFDFDLLPRYHHHLGQLLARR